MPIASFQTFHFGAGGGRGWGVLASVCTKSALSILHLNNKKKKTKERKKKTEKKPYSLLSDHKC